MRQSLASSTQARVSCSGILLELGLEPLEQGHGISRRPGKTGDDRAAGQWPHLAGIGLDDGLADGHLAVARNHHPVALAKGQDRGAVPLLGSLMGLLSVWAVMARQASCRPWAAANEKAPDLPPGLT